jgi:Fe-S oxidoreductase
MTARKLNLTAEITLTTSFQDADPMGVIYHGNYFRFFEEARRVLMLKVDYEHYFKQYAPEYLEKHKKINSKIFGATEWLYKETELKQILDKKEKSSTKVTYHDPCHFRKVQGIYKEP